MHYTWLFSVFLALTFASENRLQETLSEILDGKQSSEILLTHLYAALENRDLGVAKYILELGYLPRNSPALQSLLNNTKEQEYWDALYAFVSDVTEDEIQGARESLISSYQEKNIDTFSEVLAVVCRDDPFLETLEVIIDDKDSEFYKMILSHQKLSIDKVIVPEMDNFSGVGLTAYAVPQSIYESALKINLATEAINCHYVSTSDPNVYGVLIADIGDMQDVFPDPELLLTTENSWHWIQQLQMSIPEISGSFARFGPNRTLDIFTFGVVGHPYGKIVAVRPAFYGHDAAGYNLVPEIGMLERDFLNSTIFCRSFKVTMTLQAGDAIVFLPSSLDMAPWQLVHELCDWDPRSPVSTMTSIRRELSDYTTALTVALVD